jgi:hypothetical protein
MSQCTPGTYANKITSLHKKDIIVLCKYRVSVCSTKHLTDLSICTYKEAFFAIAMG